MADFFRVPGKKSSYHARKFLNAGNAKLKKQKFFEALESFNKCLCLAEPKSQEILLAYESRAKVFQEVGRRSSENPWNFFQLSYPENEKIPHVANCLELKSDPNFGRFIVAAHDLKPGDIIAIEEPFFMIVDTTAHHLRCSNCLKSNNMNLVPSDLCSSSMFCSQQCLEEATKNFQEAEVRLRCIDFTQKILLEALSICSGSFDKLQALIDDPTLGSKTVFDYDWNLASNAKNKMHGLIAMNSLQLGPISDELRYVDDHPVLNLFENEREKQIARNFMSRVGRILTVNCYSLDWRTPKQADDENALERASTMKVGSALLIFGSLFNHSCAPNIDRMIVDNSFVFIVRRPIRKGEQLFISYGPSFIREPNDSRQSNLRQHFHFDCSCEACVENYPIAFNHSLSNDVLTIPGGLAYPTDDWISEFKSNCQAIEADQSKFPSHALCRLMDRNLYLLAAIARNEPFVF